MSASTRHGAGVPVVAAVCLSAPLVASLLLAAALLIAPVLGQDPFWTAPDLNVSEAVFVRDRAEALRLIRAGADPDRAWEIRDAFGGPQPPSTPLEAAVRIRRLEIVQVLLGAGAHLTPESRQRLIALAHAEQADDIAQFLEQQSASRP